MVEQLVEEALNDALCAGAANQRLKPPPRRRTDRPRQSPSPLTSSSGGGGLHNQHAIPGGERQLAVAQFGVTTSGSSAVSPRRPQTVSCDTATGSSVRGAMKASAVA